MRFFVVFYYYYLVQKHFGKLQFHRRYLLEIDTAFFTSIAINEIF